jgi:hypothetical protein
MRRPLNYFDYLIACLRNPVSRCFSRYLPPASAHELLKRISGEDWGYDADAWTARRNELVKKFPKPKPKSNDPAGLRRREMKLRRTYMEAKRARKGQLDAESK